MATMTDDPHLNHVASMAGGVGRDGVRTFYRDHLVGRFGDSSQGCLERIPQL
jgi:hypothetical protein